MNKNQVFFGPAASVGPRPDNAIQALTVVVAKQLSQDRPADSEDISRVLDYMTFLEMKAAVLDDAMVNLMRLPELVSKTIQDSIGETTTLPPQSNKWTYNVEGHVCGETGRKAMTVAQVLELMKDDPDSVRSFTYDIESGKLGLDPWRLVDGINPLIKEPKSELWFDNGGTPQIVDNTTILYVQQPKKKKSA
jgi:hypothetical protein